MWFCYIEIINKLTYKFLIFIFCHFFRIVHKTVDKRRRLCSLPTPDCRKKRSFFQQGGVFIPVDPVDNLVFLRFSFCRLRLDFCPVLCFNYLCDGSVKLFFSIVFLSGNNFLFPPARPFPRPALSTEGRGYP